MPIREYIAVNPKKSCKTCKVAFEQVEQMGSPPATVCPECGNKVQRQISAPIVGGSESGLHDRAKNAGFTTYKKSSKGEYERKY